MRIAIAEALSPGGATPRTPREKHVRRLLSCG
jgi:hypothetical protein